MATTRSVLFVDDSVAFLETFTELCTVLSRQAWQVECANSVDRALAVLQAKPIDLVVLDLGMPLMDGSQLVGLIKQRYPAIKMAVMTGNATDTGRADALANGADLFVEKPVSPAGIRQVFNLLNDLMAPLPPEKSVNTAGLPEDEFVVVATYDGKWSSPNGEKKP